VLVVLAIWLLDYLKIDDPVSAVPVHLFNGVWGTLAVGLFADPVYVEKMGLKMPTVLGQLMGIGTAALWVFPLSLLLFWGMKKTVGLRVSEKEEVEGLDYHEHGNEAYAGDAISGPAVGALGGLKPAAATLRLAQESGD
jgi:Amt family ammonium transporter